MSSFATKVLDWYDQHGRHDLPWKHSAIPAKQRAYHIWLSEVMLQQTQVATVIPYYQRFVEQFPTLQTLASATQDKVLSLWSGLGYYARGRNLHKAAGLMWQAYKSVPNDFDTLLSMPGIGRSTAGAIMAQAFNGSYPILDGNVKRVLARYNVIEGWYGVSSVEKTLWAHSQEVTPKTRVADYTQAIMDIGATLCTRSKPKCTTCPLSAECVAFQTNRTHEFPFKKPKKEKPIKQVHLLCVVTNAETLLIQRPPTGIWGGLWSFPEYSSLKDLHQSVMLDYQVSKTQITRLDEFRHTFSHYHLDIHPHVLRVSDKMPVNRVQDSNSRFFCLDKSPEVGIAAPVTRLLNELADLSANLSDKLEE